ncbi:pyocin activator PrtN family protein [Paraburkholderia sp. BL10I2N1]|uniref:pyocin activator PrtN family protein n=1 Tax=Paraburkholderia sp. BL10I2N1 TaxID=1938796 RepID=UPI00105E75A1|nr:pyocin activator PrtN family protein [Paraburkholderia sp. BL10I2N1]TDN70487.1 pyocin activator protein PrtN [Paraburkholderia sp. BL10I2N1]
MKTIDILVQQFNAAFIPLEAVRLAYFPHLSADLMQRRARNNELGLPVTRFDRSQKSALGVHVEDLASYLDGRRAEARKEFSATKDQVQQSA